MKKNVSKFLTKILLLSMFAILGCKSEGGESASSEENPDKGVPSAPPTSSPSSPTSPSSPSETPPVVSAPADTIAPVFTGTISVGGVSSSELTLSWPMAVDDVTVTAEYLVVRANEPTAIDTLEEAMAVTGADLLTTPSITSTDITLTGLSSQTMYYFSVIALDESGNMALMGPVGVQTSAPPGSNALGSIAGVGLSSPSWESDSFRDNFFEYAGYVYTTISSLGSSYLSRLNANGIDTTFGVSGNLKITGSGTGFNYALSTFKISSCNNKVYAFVGSSSRGAEVFRVNIGESGATFTPMGTLANFLNPQEVDNLYCSGKKMVFFVSKNGVGAYRGLAVIDTEANSVSHGLLPGFNDPQLIYENEGRLYGYLSFITGMARCEITSAFGAAAVVNCVSKSQFSTGIGNFIQQIRRPDGSIVVIGSNASNLVYYRATLEELTADMDADAMDPSRVHTLVESASTINSAGVCFNSDMSKAGIALLNLNAGNFTTHLTLMDTPSGLIDSGFNNAAEQPLLHPSYSGVSGYVARYSVVPFCHGNDIYYFYMDEQGGLNYDRYTP